MTRDALARRSVLTAVGVAATPFVAGCLGSDDDGDGTQDLEPSDWEGIDEFVLEGHTNGWIGVEPVLDAGVRNPTLVVFDGESYELTWENADGGRHNVELWNAEDELVGDYRTGFVGERGRRQTLAFDATDEIHQYVCQPHKRSMVGYLRVVSE